VAGLVFFVGLMLYIWSYFVKPKEHAAAA